MAYLIGFIIGVAANYVYALLSFKYRKSKGEFVPRILRDTAGWSSDNGAVYFYTKDPSYRIEIGEGEDSLDSRFKKFPDKEHDTISWVRIKYNDLSLFGWNFMHLDGYRYLVPIPKTKMATEDSYYDYYDMSSTEIKIYLIIGNANMMPGKTMIEDLKDIAKMLNIQTIND